MSRPLRVEREGAIWHITSRGVERRDIYLDRDDRSYFLEFLADTVVDARWRLHSYVLMANHYHLLIETPERTLSRGMKSLNERWAERFNWRHNRVGHLFQGRFTGIVVDREAHLRELLRYIVLNPVRCGAVEYAYDHDWSNYRATAGFAPRPDWLEVDWTLAQFHEDKAVATELYRQFVAEARGANPCPWEPSGIIAAVCASFAETPETLLAKSRRTGRKAFAQLAREGGRMTFREIGNLLHVTENAAGRLAARGDELERTDAQYRATIAHARTSLSVGGV